MKIIGLTGGIGSGKSTVSRTMAELGAAVIDTDKLGHEAFRRGTAVWQRVVNAFGKNILADDGEIDRQKLGQIVFTDPAQRSRLDGIMHPAIFDRALAQVEEYRQRGAKVVIIEVPLLVEGATDWSSLIDEIWVTVASEDAVLQRLKARRGMAREAALARIRSQLPATEKARHADVIIENNGTEAELRAQVEAQWHRLARSPTHGNPS